VKLDVLALAVTVKRLNCRCRLAKAALPISRDVFLLVLVAGNHGSAEFDGLSPITRSSVATRGDMGTRASLTPAARPGHGNCRNPRRNNWRWGEGTGSSWPNRLR